MKILRDFLFTAINFAIKVLGIVMILAIILQITGRFIHQLSYMWTEELARLTFIWFCFIGIASAYFYKGHMGIDYFVKKASHKFQRFIYIFSTLLVFIFASIVTYYGIQLTALAKVQTSVMLGIPFSWFYASVPVGFGLIAIFSVFLLMEKPSPVDAHITANLTEESRTE